MIGDVRRKMVEDYLRINNLCTSGLTHPKRDCCHRRKSALRQMGEDEEIGPDNDPNGELWDYKSSMHTLERQIQRRKVKPIYNLGKEIYQFIDRSFNEVAQPEKDANG
jgi:hypothetical protein